MLTELQRNMQELRDEVRREITDVRREITDVRREITEVKQTLEGFSFIIRAAHKNPVAAPGVRVTVTGSGEGQGTQQAGKDFLLPADTHATCLQPLQST